MSSVSKRCNHEDQDGDLRRGPWTLEEDSLLIHYITCHGEGRWDLLAKCSGLKRTGKSCRLRWLNYLKPDVKRGNLTLEEQVLILELHSKWGNRWSRIAQHLPGRTDNEIKNYWRTRVQKQARQLKIDANSSRFRDAIRCFWMPRMLQKIGESSQSSFSTLNSESPPAPLVLDQTPQISLSEPQPPPPPPQGSFTHRQEYKPTTSDKSPSPSITSSFPEMGSYYMDNYTNYDMEAFNLEPPMAMGGLENSLFDCHMADTDWGNAEVPDSLWNMDDFWQYRKL